METGSFNSFVFNAQEFNPPELFLSWLLIRLDPVLFQPVLRKPEDFMAFVPVVIPPEPVPSGDLQAAVDPTFGPQIIRMPDRMVGY